MEFQKEDTQNKIISIISEKLSIPKKNIGPEASFKDLGADSLDIVEMLMGFEESFGIEISDEEAEKITTIKEAIDLIHNVRAK